MYLCDKKNQCIVRSSSRFPFAERMTGIADKMPGLLRDRWKEKKRIRSGEGEGLVAWMQRRDEGRAAHQLYTSFKHSPEAKYIIDY